ncbi:hypothetical protein ABL78_2781 [Leptomonas seymouri]|uniref:Uncharacterized protein n=1 Tax=Leptomonas seymouri TaxID=5684 RepID=A0A0N1PF49_LEPSE|nr:hypothetical protein ABL78_2781 [Leptomonas seymouri]|eukprot:KPI88148.1 hypothetical protein ABL78_2781 [Leptomonas seymouri]
MPAQPWYSEELEVDGAQPRGIKDNAAAAAELRMQPNGAAGTRQHGVAQSETYLSPYCGLYSLSPAAEHHSNRSGDQQMLYGAAALAAADVDSVENSVSCDGADARYVEIANERAFSAIQMRGGGVSGGRVFSDSPQAGLNSPLFAPHQHHSQAQQVREHSITATLTPVRTSLTSTPTPPHMHTPLHNTTYGCNFYNLMLSNALLGGLEGSSSVFSVPTARLTPPTKTQRAGPRTGPRSVQGDAATTDARVADGRTLGTVRAAQASNSEFTKEHIRRETARTLSARARLSPAAKPINSADSVVPSFCSSPHPLTSGDSKKEDEDDERPAAVLSYSRLFHAGGHQPPHRLDAAGEQKRWVAASDDQTPSVTSPVSYFQHAPPTLAGANASSLRLRFERESGSAVVFEGAEDTIHSGNAWQTSLPHPPQPMRTAGVVPNFLPFPSMAADQPEQPKSKFLLDLDAAPSQHDCMLFAPHTPMHRMAQRLCSPCTPSSLNEVNADEDAALTSPLCLPSSTGRHPGFCTPLTPRSTFVLPPFTACAASAARRGSTGGEADPIHGGCVPRKQRSGAGGSCATPLLDSDGSSSTGRIHGRGEDIGECDVQDVRSDSTRLLFAEPNPISNGVSAPGRSFGVDSDAARRSLWSSPASVGRSIAPSHVLTTPVRHYDNSILEPNNSGSLGFGSSSGFVPRGSNGPLYSSLLPRSPAAMFPTSPIGAMTPVSLSPAWQTVRYRPATAAAATTTTTVTPDGGAVGLAHVSPYRDAFLGILRSVTFGRGSTSRRDAFHFVRAMTASETSTNPLHSPFYWGCFGVLVAQLAEVWCVGEAQPFRIYPHEADQAASVLHRRSTITAIASTTLLSVATWEEAGMTEETPAPMGTVPPVSQAITTATHDIAYLAVGTSAGDVIVYAYGKCSNSSPGAVAVSHSSPKHMPPPPHEAAVYAVKLQQCGTLKFADRVRVDGTQKDMDETYGSCNSLHSRTPSVPTIDDEERQHQAISVLRVVGPWLYIGDQSGHISRYDLRHNSFLRKLSEYAVPSLPSAPHEGAYLQSPRATTRSAAEGASTPARVFAPLNPCMPVHHFARPGATLPAKVAASKVSLTSPGGVTSLKTPPCFHFAVHTGEPVYNLEVTENHGYLAVGTQTRLLVYRVAEMPRVADAVAVNVSLSASRREQHAHSTASYALACTPPSDVYETRRTVLGTPVEPTAPLVVVSNAPQPIRCFAWMRCDYEALIGAKSGRARGDDVQAAPAGAEGDVPDRDAVGDDVTRMGADVGTLRSFSSLSYTPTPSLVFASACFDFTETAAVGSDEAMPAQQRLKTDIQLYRIVTQSVVASCTLDYPVHFLKAVAGTTQIIIGTGSSAELQPLPSSPSLPSTLSPVQARQGTGPQTQLLTPTPTPPHHSVHARSLSATMIPSNPLPSTTLSRSQAPVGQRRRSTPSTLAAMAALRVLTAGESRPSPGLRYTPHSTVPSSSFPTTRVGSTLMRQNSGARLATSTPDASSTSQRPRARIIEDREQHGFLFKLEVCPCAGDGARHAESNGCVCFRSRGEIVVGESESAFSGYLSPAQDQVAALVQPARDSLRRTGAASTAPVKVKVWELISVCRGSSFVSSARHAPAHPSATLGSAAPAMESLR